ncbi:MAG: hypothetical protein ACRD25_08150, partial [Terracidiphilus sp.]
MPIRRALFPIVLVVLICSAPMAARQDAEKSSSSLEALSGEYTNAADPDTPLSFYPQGGKLTIESERLIPMELKSISATEFEVP